MKIEALSYSMPPVRAPKFRGYIKPVLKPAALDTFEKSAESISLENLYNKLFLKMNQVTPENIESLIHKLNKYPKKQVLLVLNKLTSFSNTDKILDFKLWLESKRIEHIEDFRNIYEKRRKVYHYNTEPKDSNTDIEHHKVVKDIIPFGLAPNINNVFSYLYNNSYGVIAKCPLSVGRYNAIILDSKTITMMEELKKTNPDLFNTFLDRYKFVYIKDFENSYNIFEQHQDLEKATESKLSKLNTINKLYPNRTDEELINIIMNGKNLNRIKKLGINPLIADLNQNTNPSSKDIASNLSQTFPEKSTFMNVISKCLDKACSSVSERKDLISYLDKNFYPYSFKSLGQKLIKLKEMIENDVKKSGGDTSKIYYNVARMNKSFVLINYMYQRANNIPPNRFVYWENIADWDRPKQSTSGYKNMKELLPKGSTLVILDDAFISGESILQTQFKYHPYRDKDSFDIIFGSVYSSDKAKELLNKSHKKIRNDRMISVDNQKLENIPIKNNGFEPYKNTLILFPYNSPDNNSAIFQDLYNLFYPSRSFVQSSWIYE